MPQASTYQEENFRTQRSHESLSAVAWRFWGLWSFITLLALFYSLHPYYQRPWFAPWQWVATRAYWAFCLFSPAYVWATYRWQRRRSEDFSDPALLFLSGGRHLWYTLRRASWRPWLRYWRSGRVHHFLRAVAVKVFFLPLMAVFLSQHANESWRLWTTPRLSMTWTAWLNWSMALTSQVLFLCDTAIATVGYGFESKWLGNRTRSVEKTWFGWIVCLMCYPPFNDVSHVYLPLGDGANHMGWSSTVLLTLRGASLICFGVYVWATVALGVRFSNLSNKGIVTRGPYRWVRHPAYLSKNLAWWCEQIPGMAGGQYVLPLLAWNIVYMFRGLTEERHLRSDPDYRAYCERVPYRFIPGVW